ncbi:hypothetical protein BJ508DRAFT_328409 [Ascobolus immersus RN42]|uniref:Uncharacterized protein n=1 Tax=Ascobolus immersus RN42 TaxID=1160509 RepID=A0A3N4HZP3_ASCIM|nr:hypothetical protein BJ508DRAFT_328409 [Ascobolus immersus RN42]
MSPLQISTSTYAPSSGRPYPPPPPPSPVDSEFPSTPLFPSGVTSTSRKSLSAIFLPHAKVRIFSLNISTSFNSYDGASTIRITYRLAATPFLFNQSNNPSHWAGK